MHENSTLLTNTEIPLFKFEKLLVYQKAMDFVDVVYNTVRAFPNSETFALSSQFKRAAQSIVLNIAEGNGQTNSQFSRYLNISIGSLRECVVCISIAERQNFITKENSQLLRSSLIEISKMITGLLKSLK